MSKNEFTKREELICGKIDKAEELAAKLQSVELIDILHEIRSDAERMEKKLISRKLETKFDWNKFDFNDIETRPKTYGKYLICRKDGKVHWETWNGSGWAYNHNEIIYWATIKHPITGEIVV